MRTKHVALWLATLLLAGVVVAGDVVLPTFAQNLEGKGGNRWSTEIYLTNPNPTPLAVSLVDVYYGKVSMPHPCLPPSPVAWEIPPASSVGWMALAIWRDIGCPDSVVGGLLLRADGPFVVNSRPTERSNRLVIELGPEAAALDTQTTATRFPCRPSNSEGILSPPLTR